MKSLWQTTAWIRVVVTRLLRFQWAKTNVSPFSGCMWNKTLSVDLCTYVVQWSSNIHLKWDFELQIWKLFEILSVLWAEWRFPLHATVWFSAQIHSYSLLDSVGGLARQRTLKWDVFVISIKLGKHGIFECRSLWLKWSKVCGCCFFQQLQKAPQLLLLLSVWLFVHETVERADSFPEWAT